MNLVEKIIKPIYNRYIRHHLPRRFGVYDTIPARDVRWFDFTDVFPDYKSGLHTAIENHIREGETVTLIGGGRGVSSVWLARQGADVIAYEAAQEMIAIAQQTVEIQGIAEAVEFRHALVGEAIEVYGEYEAADQIHPTDVLMGDSLVMDCEGAEKSILEKLSDYPETIIVETHPERGVADEKVRSLLESSNFNIRQYQYEPNQQNKNIYVAENKRRVNTQDTPEPESIPEVSDD